jgi:hypothetical protein
LPKIYFSAKQNTLHNINETEYKKYVANIKNTQVVKCEFAVFYFNGAFAELRRATISLVTPARMSVRIERLGSRLTDFDDIWHLIFLKPFGKIQVLLKSDKNSVYFT